MGREHDLLDAARTGNCTVIEKIVAQRHKRMGQLPLALQAPLASLTRRTLNINCQDSNGDTPLHLAALNGHAEAVRLLLQHEGSANMEDSRGCFPLHLAAWNGHANICRILLTHGPSIAKVNEQNAISETALHCAAQYGHDQVVSVLLEYHANPNFRNHHNESPLDLACQYGRLETAQQLLRRHPTLPCHNIDKHSPLHLAARNGHRQVVQLLLDAGFDINTRMETGTALHEAAIFGKGDVVRLLLDNGIDTSLTDSESRTALEVLSEHRSQISLDIGNIILDHTEGIDSLYRRSCFLPNMSTGVYDTVSLQEPLTSLRYRDNKVTSATSPDVYELYTQVVRQEKTRPTHGSKESMSSFGSSIHEVPPIPPKLCEEEPIYDTPMPVSRVAHSSPAPVPKPRLLLPSSGLGGSTNSLQHSPTDSTRSVTPKKPPRRHPPSPRGGGGGGKSVDVVPKLETCQEKPGNVSMVTQYSADHEMGQSGNEWRTLGSGSRTGSERTDSEGSDMGMKYRASIRVHVAGRQPLLTATSSGRREEILSAAVERIPATCEVCEDGTEYYISEKSPTTEGEEKTVCGSLHDKKCSDTQEAVMSSSRPPSLEFNSQKTREFPLSPTGYTQPPTPDHPPPSPSRAANDIQEQINPGEKRRSKDMETITEAELLSQCMGATPCPLPRTLEEGTINSTTGLLQLLRDHTARRSTVGPGDPIEIVANQNNPFLGLCKGSIPLDESRAKAQLYENLIIQQRRRVSAPGSCVGFDPVEEENIDTHRHDVPIDGQRKTVMMRSRMSERKVKSELDQNRNRATTLQEGEDAGEHPLDETEEWAKIFLWVHMVDCFLHYLPPHTAAGKGWRKQEFALPEVTNLDKIADIMASFGGGITRESLFLDLLERDFRALLTAAVDRTRQDGPPMQSVGDWLDSLGLPQYENTLVANGFDDMDFMGPNVLDRNDLLTLNITDPDHQDRILTAAAKVPRVKSIAEDSAPTSVEEWLRTLRLSDYLDTFQRNNFTTVDKVRNVWELELNSVLDAVTLGHRKRILASLSIPPSELGGANGGRDPDDPRRMVKWSFSRTERHNVDSLDLFKDYTKQIWGDQDRGDGENRAGTRDDRPGQQPQGSQEPSSDMSHCEDISLRPPHGGDGGDAGVRQWRHKPEVLVKGCCNYSAQYLGSALVKQLQGVGSTKDSINKMKKSTSNMGKVPVIVLSISYQGVKFIDAKSKRVICEHAISNIFCACQDGENLNYFAYITKDLMSDRHYCHVFNVKSTDMATEIILTLGEAFEVAYQIALRSQTAQVERTTPSTTEPSAGMEPPAGTATPVSSADARDDGVSGAESGQTSYRESTF